MDSFFNSNVAVQFLSIFVIGLLTRIVVYYGLTGLAYLFFWQSKNPTVQNMRLKTRFESQPKAEALWALPTLVIFSFSLALIFQLKSFTKLYFSIYELGLGYFVAIPIFLVFLHDAYFYFTHRLMHWEKFYKKVHYLHHRFKAPTPFAALAFHPLEAVVDGFFAPVVILLLPLHPFHVFLLFALMLVNNVYIHLGYEFKSLKFQQSKLGRIFFSPELHLRHHEGLKGNFGLYFTFWDHFFGTLVKRN